MNNKFEINDFKKEDIAILAHYYVDGKIQEVADYIGDSFFLAQKATELKEKNIIMAGVYFMGESIKILNPEKRVFMVNRKADCPMAHMVTIESIENMRKKYDDLAVVCYVNSTAEIKAHSDVCVTSSNAVSIVKKLKEKNIYFIPDKNLGAHVQAKVKEKNIILQEGWCPVHNGINKFTLESLKEKHRNAPVLAHPECNKDVLELADYIGSTKGILEEAGKRSEDEIIIATEQGILHKLKEQYPNKTFYMIDGFICSDMKIPTLEELISCTSNPENEVELKKEVSEKAYLPLKRMLELGR